MGAVGLLAAMLVLAPAASDGEAGSVWRSREWTDVAGRVWTAADLEGRVVLLDFWATWCPPCLEELPNLRRLHRRFEPDDLVIVGVALDSLDRRRLRAFLLRRDIVWPQVHEPRGVEAEIARRFGVEAVPVTVLVDRAGRVVARDLRGRALAATVETLVRLERRQEPEAPGDRVGATRGRPRFTRTGAVREWPPLR